MGGAVEVGASGRVSLAGTPYLAGSSLSLCDALPNAMAFAGISLADAVDLATLNPARLLGVEAERGRLLAGQPADLILFRLDAAARGSRSWRLSRRARSSIEDSRHPPPPALIHKNTSMPSRRSPGTIWRTVAQRPNMERRRRLVILTRRLALPILAAIALAIGVAVPALASGVLHACAPPRLRQ